MSCNARLRKYPSTNYVEIPNIIDNYDRCPVCGRQLRLSTSRVLSYRLVPCFGRPVKRQHFEVTVTLKLCSCGYWDKETNEEMLEEIKVKT